MNRTLRNTPCQFLANVVNEIKDVEGTERSVTGTGGGNYRSVLAGSVEVDNGQNFQSMHEFQDLPPSPVPEVFKNDIAKVIDGFSKVNNLRKGKITYKHYEKLTKSFHINTADDVELGKGVKDQNLEEKGTRMVLKKDFALVHRLYVDE